MPKFNVQRNQQPSGVAPASVAPSGLVLAPLLPTPTAAPAMIAPEVALARMGFTGSTACTQFYALTVPQRQARLGALLSPTPLASQPVANQRWVSAMMNAFIPYCLGAGGAAALLHGFSAPGPSPEGTPVEWRRLVVKFEDNDIRKAVIRYPSGRQVTDYPLQTQILGIPVRVFHWAAPEAADAWFREAERLLFGRDAAGKYMADLLDARSPREQFDYLKSVCVAITNGANALNIVLHNDPVTRATDRRFLAGMPVASSPRQEEASLYDPAVSYGGDLPADANDSSGWSRGAWFVARSTVPVIADPDQSVNAVNTTARPPLPAGPGLIPQDTRRSFVTYYGKDESWSPWPSASWTAAARLHPNNFIQTLGFTLALPPGASAAPGGAVPASLHVELNPDVVNGYWIAQDDQNLRYFSPNSAYPILPDSIKRYSAQSTVIDKSGNRNAGRSSTPRSELDWGDSVFGVTLGQIATVIDLNASIGPRQYIGYLREVVAGLRSRRPDQIIQDVRAQVAFSNSSLMAKLHGLPNFLRDISSGLTDIEDQRTHPNAAVDTTAGVAFSLGASLAVETYGISAVIGGAVGAVLLIANRYVDHPIEGHGKDDRGRWKPILERAWLSGDPSSAEAIAKPAHVIPSPPRFFAPNLSHAGRPYFQTQFGLPTLPDEGQFSDGDADRIMALGDGARAEFSRLYCQLDIPADGFASQAEADRFITSHPWCDRSLAIVRSDIKNKLKRAAPYVAVGLVVALAGAVAWKKFAKK